ncbi:MAG: hypothetical protein NPINA01_21490 [Nitrospinaceae bacterium]|jgi:integrase|nr:MAG: hypothetical protein NPINA01_21490 [Nitrospinaceae bacterium]
MMGGKVHVYKRENSRYWQCSTYLSGKNRRTSTKQESLAHAKDFAEDWYLELRGKSRRGELKDEKTFKEAAAQFGREYEIITEGQRNPIHVKNYMDKLRLHLIPFFGEMGLSEITPGQVQEYRIHRREKSMEQRGKPPSRSTMHKEIVTLRQTLKTAIRHGWLQYLPDLSEPYKTSGKISHRAWFSPEEYKQLYEATRHRAQNPPKPQFKWGCEQVHDFVLFMANTGLRPDEVWRLEYRDVQIIEYEPTGEQILEIQVRGKRGVGYCKSMTGAVRPFERLKERNNPEPTDLLFPKRHRELFNRILKEENLKFDREGQARTAYSLRHTYICLRLMEGADIYQIAKNCRTSVEMIEKYYASHISTTLDAEAINKMKSKPTPKSKNKSKTKKKATKTKRNKN